MEQQTDKKPGARVAFDLGPGAVAVIIFLISTVAMHLPTCANLVRPQAAPVTAPAIPETEPYAEEDCASIADLGVRG